MSSTPTVTVASICTAPSMSTTSRLVVPSISALPEMSRVVASNSPATVTTPLVKVIKSVSLVCPIVVPLIITLSTVSVESVPTDVRLGIAVISSSKYAAKSVTATCTIVPLSFITTLSASATVVDVAVVSPSRMFTSVVETVSPSNTSSSASDIPAEPIVSVPEMSTLPLMSIVVAAICISVSATKSSCPSALELMYIAVSRNCIFSVEATSMSSENSK